jgi:hypothetical protein
VLVNLELASINHRRIITDAEQASAPGSPSFLRWFCNERLGNWNRIYAALTPQASLVWYKGAAEFVRPVVTGGAKRGNHFLGCIDAWLASRPR